jgi:glycerol-3-phosphate O-acyltransferase
VPETSRSEDDRRFVRWLRHELARADERRRRALVDCVCRRYTAEIGGHFDARVYRFATGLLPPALGALLHGGRPSKRMLDVRDRVLIEGELDALRAAAHAGTLLLVSTHVSNLDSLLLGYAIYALGLPPVAYGAGLNLFTNALTGFFMRNLGAFTVDRSKTDPLYRAAVKEYTTALLERGQHTLFFPGGTRSRSGAIEQRLKLGLLGTAVTAFGNRRARDAAAPPVFIVPCTLSYPLVLEASSLVQQYLRREGGPHFVACATSSSARNAGSTSCCSWLSSTCACTCASDNRSTSSAIRSTRAGCRTTRAVARSTRRVT